MAEAQTPDVDGLAARIVDGIKKLGSRREPDGDDPDDLDTEGRRSVSVETFRARVRREVDRRRVAEEGLAGLQAQVEELTRAAAARDAALREEAAASIREVTGRHQEDLALVDLGVTDPLGRRTIRAAWDELPKDARGKSPVEWWRTVADGHRAHLADPKKATAPEVPRVLTPYLPAAPQDAGRAAGGGTPKPPPSTPDARGGFNLDSVPTDQGMGAFLDGLRRLEP